jgi:hypothetical protein
MFNRGARIEYAEYFVNDDSLATEIPVGPGGTSVLLEICEPEMSLSDVIYLRCRDSYGRWSAATGRKYGGIRLEYSVKYQDGTTSLPIEVRAEAHGDPPLVEYEATWCFSCDPSPDSLSVRFRSDRVRGDWVRAQIDTANCPNVPVDDESGESVPGGAEPTVLAAFASNPYSPGAGIWVAVPPPGGKVTLKVFDLAGREVVTLVANEWTRGVRTLRWDGGDREGRPLASGTYFLELVSGDEVRTRKFVIVQ